MDIPTTNNDSKIATVTNYSPAEVAILKTTVAKKCNDIELAYFLNVCKTVNLNPFIKEIWCYKDNKNNLLVFAGRDGFLTVAQRDPKFNGLRSCEVRDKDEFSIDIANNKITHNVTQFGAVRGAITGAYAIVFRKDGESTLEMADFGRYNKGSFVWKTHPEAMIKKVVETNALKKAFGINGLSSEYDFNINQGVAVPIGPNQSDKETVDFIEFVHKNTKSVEILKKCQEAAKNQQLTPEFMEETKKRIEAENDNT